MIFTCANGLKDGCGFLLWFRKEDSKRQPTLYKLLVDLSHHDGGCDLNPSENDQSPEGSLKEIHPNTQTPVEESADKLYSESIQNLIMKMKSDCLKNSSNSPPRASSPNPPTSTTNTTSSPPFASNARTSPMLISVHSSTSFNTSATSTTNHTTFTRLSRASTSPSASWTMKIYNIMSLPGKLMHPCTSWNK